MIRGALIRRGGAAAGLGRVTGASGQRHEGGDGEALDNEVFHIWDSCLVS
jgi:hypothetical protein